MRKQSGSDKALTETAMVMIAEFLKDESPRMYGAVRVIKAMGALTITKGEARKLLEIFIGDNINKMNEIEGGNHDI